MMDAVEYIKEKVRMCHSDPIEKFKCDRCPMFADTIEIGCVYWEETDPTEAVRIVEEWSKAHPIQTNGMKLKKDFGLPGVEKVFNAGRWMYALLEQWWNAPYEGPKGETDDR